MTRVQHCGDRSLATGAVNPSMDSTMGPSPLPQPQELPSPSLSKVRKLCAFDYLASTYVMAETGSQVWLYGGLLNITSANGQILSYPTANYLIDDFPGELDGNAAHFSYLPIPHYSRYPNTMG